MQSDIAVSPLVRGSLLCRHVRWHRPCQFMSQQYRLASWLSSWFSAEMAEAGFMHKQAVPPLGFNVQSPHPLAYFSERVMTSQHVAPGTVGFLAPRFSRVVPWDAFLCAQAALGRELPWSSLESDPTFPASFDLLLRLLRVHPQPLKLLSVVAPSRLFELINTVEMSASDTSSAVAQVLQLLGDHVLDADTMTLTRLRGQISLSDSPTDAAASATLSKDPLAGHHHGAGSCLSALSHHLAVLKWCLLQTAWGATRFTFTGDDLRRLIELKIPLAVAPSQAASVLPLLKQLEGVGSSNFLYRQVELRNTLLSLGPEFGPFVFAATDKALPTVAAEGDKHAASFRPPSDDGLVTTQSGAGGAGGAGGAATNAAPTPSSDADASTAASLTCLSSALVEFFLAPAVMQASQRAELAGQRLLITHPFVRHIQAWSSSNDRAHLFRTSGRSGRAMGRSVYVDNGDGDNYPMLASSAAFWAGFADVVGSPLDARTVWANYCALSAEALAFLVSRASTPQHVRWMKFVVYEVVRELSASGASPTDYLRELLCGLQESDDAASLGSGFSFVQELFDSAVLREYLRADALELQGTFVGALLESLMVTYQETHARADDPAGPQLPDPDAAPLIDFYLASRQAGVGHRFIPPFPLHSAPLEARYYRRFNDEHYERLRVGDVSRADVDALVEEHLYLLGRRGFTLLCERLSARATRCGRDEFHNRTLLLVAWVFYPFHTLSVTRDEFAQLRLIAEHPKTEFAATVRRHSSAVSALALFLASSLCMDVPACLPAGVYNSFAARFGPTPLQEHSYLVCQTSKPRAQLAPQYVPL